MVYLKLLVLLVMVLLTSSGPVTPPSAPVPALPTTLFEFLFPGVKWVPDFNNVLPIKECIMCCSGCSQCECPARCEFAEDMDKLLDRFKTYTMSEEE
ncbi:hypothetical protein L596_026241 [Steinernema carpocapsae]|uniref:4Fe-4S ferredoxin-type domain-containing protein n=1 Tax=Steinernema carpocapsae TaxID=34508 RepID=A0A4U5M1S3_STECR|nr:hypothetical protein L596_026241 [Steinernema carpocapsae]